ncbi:MAG TPA: hypothetical protein VK964_07640 [Nocardioidaceae bacterium]|nr:hypothetical protein [Nocardioidaceae bacterium]
MDLSTGDTLIFVSVVLARFVAPLLIPLFPLPAILTCLVLDAVDRDIFISLGGFDPESYQGIDKALDIFYLTIAMLSVLRNWTQQTAARVARFLFYYRLVGVTAFELSEWRPLLLIFPNTFEYFFILYELLRGRRSPSLMTGRFYVVSAALIWVFVKLPQEYWIHVAQLDFTDTVRQASPAVLGVLLGAALVLAVGLRAAAHRFVPPPERGMVLAADPLPENIDTARERAWLLNVRWRLLDVHLAEKILLVGLVTVIFGQVIPEVRASPLQLTLGVAVVATFSAALTLRAARTGRNVESVFWEFALLSMANVVFVVVASVLLRRSAGDIDVGTTLFFLLQLSLMVALYDRFKPVYDVRFMVQRTAA